MSMPGGAPLAAAVGRGAAFLAGAGAALGGAAGTVDWPIVGTFFGALAGAAAGALAGAVDGLALAGFLAGVTSKWPARAVSAGVALATELVAVRFYRGPAGTPAVVEAALVVLGVIAAVAVGPLVAYGARPAVGATAGPVPAVQSPWRAPARVVAWGAGAGVGIGAMSGLVIGVRAYLPTSPFAAVEGALLGLVSGVVLACMAVGVVVLPKMRARR